MNPGVNAEYHSETVPPAGWEQWQLKMHESRETRDLAQDSFALLYGQKITEELTQTEIQNLPELTALATCDSLIFFEQMLFVIDRAYTKKNPQFKNPALRRVEREELIHLRAFRLYAKTSRLFSRFFVNGKKTFHPGQRGRSMLKFPARILAWQAKTFPQYSYLFILLSELFSMEIGKRLMRDFGSDCPDTWVQLNRLHLRDEAPHTKICLDQAAQIYKNLSFLGRISFWFFNISAVLLSGFVGAGGNFQAFSSMSVDRPKSFLFKLRALWVVMKMSSAIDSPYKHMMKSFDQMCRSKFDDRVSLSALRLLKIVY